jgi:uncharacterized protein (TIGR03000 family)
MHASRLIARSFAPSCLAVLIAALAAPDCRAQPYARPAPAVVSIVNNYAPPAGAPAPALTAAIEVRLPPQAELWFDGTPMAQAGDRRLFLTPPLQPGVTYTYEVSARWRQQGEEVKRYERLAVRAGESLVVEFGPPRRPSHTVVRDIPRDAAAASRPVGHGALTEVSRGQAPARPVPEHMAVIEIDGQPARTPLVPPGRMSIVDFDAPRH